MKKLLKAFSQNKGFTLIELLVVVAIIGMLAAASTQSVGRAISKSRDARRKADVKAISTAMELYYQDNGVYPDVGLGGSTWAASTTAGDWLGAALIPQYLKVPPRDPIDTRGYYVYSPWGTGYIIYTNLEDAADKDLVGSKARDDSGNTWGPYNGRYIKGKQ